MLAGIFDFSGRLGRWAYLRRGLAVTLGGGAVLAVLAATLAVSLGTLGAGRMLILAAVVVLGGLVVLAMLVASLALMVRRLRDIGLPPLVSCLVIIGFQALDLLVIAPQIAGSPPGSHVHHALPGTLVNLAVACVLLFCPGHRRDGGGERPSVARGGGSVPSIGDPGRRLPGFGQRGAAS